MVRTEIPGTEILNDWTLWTLAEARAALGDKPMLTVDDDDVVTYGGLYERARRVAASLRRLGVGPGETVASFGYNSTDQAVLLFACAAIGAVWVPLNLSLVGEDLVYTLNDTNSATLVVDAELVPRYQEVATKVGIQRVFVRGEGDYDTGRYDAFADLAAADPGDFVARPSAPQEAIAAIYTGGSTGCPKVCSRRTRTSWHSGCGIRRSPRRRRMTSTTPAPCSCTTWGASSSRWRGPCCAACRRT